MSKRFSFCMRMVWVLGLCAICSGPAFAREYVWEHPGQDKVLGQDQFYVASGHETYAQIAAILDVAYDNLSLANPGVGPRVMRLDQVYQPHAGTVLVIPDRVLLPSVPYVGIVINVAEKRLYYFQPQRHRVFIYPIGVGRADWETPLGQLKIYEKIKNPVWIVPDSIMRFRQKHGDSINKIVQSGPDNPLGYFALRLSNHSYLIHGTNDPTGVGRRSSAGCIRLYSPDIKQLFKMVQAGTSVLIVNMPFKVAEGGRNDRVYVSFHRPFFQENLKEESPLVTIEQLFKKQSLNNVFVVSKKSIEKHRQEMTGLVFSPAEDISTITKSAVKNII